MVECKKCIHKEVCKTAESCDGYVSGCKHFNPGWISVKDRLPELHTKVLCCGKKGGRFIAELSTWGKEEHLCWDKRNGQGCPTVTHWMPQPEPPKGE